MTAPTQEFPLLVGDPVRVPVDEAGVPNFRASSGESGEPIGASRFTTADEGKPRTRPGIFGRDFGSRTRQARTTRERKTRTTPAKLNPSIKGKIRDLYVLIGGFVRPFDEAVGDTIIEQAPMCAKAVYDYAQENETFRRAIQWLVTGSMQGALIFAHLPILLAILTKTSKNEQVKMTALGSLVAMKMANQETINKLVQEMEEEDAKRAEGQEAA